MCFDKRNARSTTLQISAHKTLESLCEMCSFFLCFMTGCKFQDNKTKRNKRKRERAQDEYFEKLRATNESIKRQTILLNHVGSVRGSAERSNWLRWGFEGTVRSPSLSRELIIELAQRIKRYRGGPLIFASPRSTLSDAIIPKRHADRISLLCPP